MKGKILITGSNGLLGQKLVQLFKEQDVDFIATSKGVNRNIDCPQENYAEMDVTNKASIQEVFEKYRPSAIIHTAAMTNVDYCEQNPEDCRKVNVEAVESLIMESNKIGVHFQLLSTDFIFDGEKGNYKEEDEPNPLSVYGKSKLDAEILVKTKSKNGSIVRTIIVYGKGNNLSRSNLILWAKSSLEQGKEINIIDDQFRAPTYSVDLAKACYSIIKKKKQGVFHISGPETLSIYEIVERIAKYFNYPMDRVNRISSKTLNQPAKRPPKTGFDLSKSKRELGFQPLTLEESLNELFSQKTL